MILLIPILRQDAVLTVAPVVLLTKIAPWFGGSLPRNRFPNGCQGLRADSLDDRKLALNAFRWIRWAILISAGLLVTSLAGHAAEGDIASPQVAAVSEAVASQAIEATSSAGHDEKPSIKEFQSAKGAGPN